MANLSEIIIGKMPDVTKTMVFLDFDDVVNVFGEYRDKTDVVTSTVTIPCGTQKPALGSGSLKEDKQMEIAWRPAIVEKLKNMNVIWLTSWKHLTQSLLNPALGTDFGYADWEYRGFSDDGRYGKADAVARIIKELNVPYVVVDDCYYDSWQNIFTENYIPGIEAKIIAPERDEGLTMAQLSEIEAFITAHLDG